MGKYEKQILYKWVEGTIVFFSLFLLHLFYYCEMRFQCWYRFRARERRQTNGTIFTKKTMYVFSVNMSL